MYSHFRKSVKHAASLLIVFPLFAILHSCSDRHFITSPSYRQTVETDLAARTEALSGNFSMDSVLSLCRNGAEQEAMRFLYAYMPIGDVADYPASLYLEGVRSAFRARAEMPWGKDVPEDLFRHFVLPLRVNNENLDASRTDFYAELKDRVRSLSMYDAVLEVNHWCHEKVIYTPSDIRTSTPSATVRTAYGRCGEESVFTVAALRSVGIPARQVYTPRWAHTDDNHAWVEAWVDGTWHYLGACEPEARLDVAWFSSTALRGLLMHTKVFGSYLSGSEDVISRTRCYTEINVTSNYAPVARVNVTVLGTDGNPVKDAVVEYKIYNYSEYFSAITARTDSLGRSSATFGFGDITVWCSDGERFGYAKVTVKEGGSSVTVVLDKDSSYTGYEDADIVPPAEGKAKVVLTEEERIANARRLAEEDSIRSVYTSTFATEADAVAAFGETMGRNYLKYLVAARGNWREISAYLSASAGYGQNATELLALISEKDFRDTPASILLDHIANFRYTGDNAILKEYVLNPRIAEELLSPYRSFFLKEAENGAFGETVTPESILALASRVRVADEYNPQAIPVSPSGVYRLMAADRHSRDIFAVAAFRTFSIPARIEEVSGKLQYHDGHRWVDVDLDAGHGAVSVSPKGKLLLSYAGQEHIDNPKYETHFTISRIEGGRLFPLSFTDREGREGSMTWKGVFGQGPVELDCGQYMMLSGTRMASGKVLATMTFFRIEKGRTTRAVLKMREDSKDLQVIGSMNVEAKYRPVSVANSEWNASKTGKESSEVPVQTSILETVGRGFFVMGFLKANHEPSNHAIRGFFQDVPPRPLLLLYADEDEYGKYLTGGFPECPDGISFGIDEGDTILNAVCKELKIAAPEYPVIVIADSFGRIVYLSEGYNIGTAGHVVRLLKGL